MSDTKALEFDVIRVVANRKIAFGDAATHAEGEMMQEEMNQAAAELAELKAENELHKESSLIWQRTVDQEMKDNAQLRAELDDATKTILEARKELEPYYTFNNNGTGIMAASNILKSYISKHSAAWLEKK